MKKIFFTFLIIFSVFAVSCSNEITVSDTNEGIKITFNTIPGPVFLQTINALEGTEENQDFFDTEIIECELENAFFQNPVCKKNNENGFKAEFYLSKSAKDPVSISELIFNKQNKPGIILSKQKFELLYKNLPYQLQSYIDLFMTPSFTGEEMSDDEYLELVSEVYGQKLSEEIKKAKITFLLKDKNKNVSKTTLSLLRIINIVGKLELQ